AGVSYAALARTVCEVAGENGDRDFRCDKSSVGHWVAGTRPQQRTALYLTEALSRRLGRALRPADLGLGSAGERLVAGPPVAVAPVAGVELVAGADVDRRALIGGMAYSVAALMLPLQQPDIAARGDLTRARGRLTVGAGEVAAVRAMTAAFNA